MLKSENDTFFKILKECGHISLSQNSSKQFENYELTRVGKLVFSPPTFGYEDVFVVPKYNEVLSRKNVDLKTRFSRNIVIPTPIICSNMSCVINSKFALKLWEYGIFSVLHRFYNAKEEMIQEAININDNSDMPLVISVGVNGFSQECVCEINKRCNLKGVLIDVAHGHSKQVIETIKSLKSAYPQLDIIAGNIATKEAVFDLHKICDGLKVGIGTGCFAAGTLVKTKEKHKPIENIAIGDEVLTHKGTYEKVVATTQREETQKLFSINGIKCTANHEFYVLHKRYLDFINEDIIDISFHEFSVLHKRYLDFINEGTIDRFLFLHEKHFDLANEFAKWVCAENITKEFLLLELKDHRSFSQRGKDGDAIQVYTLARIDEVQEAQFSGIVYDIEVENNHSYAVSENNIIVHNSVCQTSSKTGAGSGILTTIMECCDAASSFSSSPPIIADGGISEPSDVVKALIAGADSCMAGKIFARCPESAAETVKDFNGNYFKIYYGMASNYHKNKIYDDKSYVASEGIVAQMPIGANCDIFLPEFLGGVRSGFTYSGAENIIALHKNGELRRATQVSVLQSKPHALCQRDATKLSN